MYQGVVVSSLLLSLEYMALFMLRFRILTPKHNDAVLYGRSIRRKLYHLLLIARDS